MPKSLQRILQVHGKKPKKKSKKTDGEEFNSNYNIIFFCKFYIFFNLILS